MFRASPSDALMEKLPLSSEATVILVFWFVIEALLSGLPSPSLTIPRTRKGGKTSKLVWSGEEISGLAERKMVVFSIIKSKGWSFKACCRNDFKGTFD